MVIVAAFITVSFVNRLMAGSIRGFDQRLSLPSLLGFTRVMKDIVWLIAALLILSLWGVSVSGLWTLLVATAMIIGVGFLTVWAMISNVKGRVVVRNLMFTALREENGARLLVLP